MEFVTRPGHNVSSVFRQPHEVGVPNHPNQTDGNERLAHKARPTGFVSQQIDWEGSRGGAEI